ncbi:hypothetical protein ON010_g1264 [Phytophthora cinnamomi]|nr:hypothetical protein ON010_g1264 [Phytophthora cinnamomi]
MTSSKPYYDVLVQQRNDDFFHPPLAKGHQITNEAVCLSLGNSREGGVRHHRNLQMADLLLRPGGFTLCTDRRNLKYIFNPQSVDSNLTRFHADKLQRWASTLTLFNYHIERVPGKETSGAIYCRNWGGQRSRRRHASGRAVNFSARSPRFLLAIGRLCMAKHEEILIVPRDCLSRGDHSEQRYGCP